MATVSRGNGPHVLRQLNAAAVLNALRTGGEPLRVADLMTRTGLTRPTVTRRVRPSAPTASTVPPASSSLRYRVCS